MAKLSHLKYRKPTTRQSQSDAGRRHLLCRSVMQWLARQAPPPDVLAVDVPTSMGGDKADLAALWMGQESRGGHKYLLPRRGALVVCAISREECYAASINPAALIEELRHLRKQMHLLEEKIRKEEPQLRDERCLFEEFAEWNYENSQNPLYQATLQRAAEIEHILYRGTRMDRIQRNAAANTLYLAIPEGTVFVDEVMLQWGVITVDPDGEVRLARSPEEQSPAPRTLQHLALQAAVRNSNYVCAGFGIPSPGERHRRKSPGTRKKPQPHTHPAPTR